MVILSWFWEYNMEAKTSSWCDLDWMKVEEHILKVWNSWIPCRGLGSCYGDEDVHWSWIGGGSWGALGGLRSWHWDEWMLWSRLGIG